jgi:hypothetical protein
LISAAGPLTLEREIVTGLEKLLKEIEECAP